MQTSGPLLEGIHSIMKPLPPLDPPTDNCSLFKVKQNVVQPASTGAPFLAKESRLHASARQITTQQIMAFDGASNGSHPMHKMQNHCYKYVTQGLRDKAGFIM